MRKQTYQLSPQYELIENTEKLAAHGYNSTVLWNKAEDEYLLLNPLITKFLKAFQQQTSLHKVVLFFQNGTEDTAKDIESALKPFFKSMCDRGIIVPSEMVENPKPEMPNGEGLQIGEYTLDKRLSCTPPMDIYVAKDPKGRKFLLKRLLFEPSFPEKYRPKFRRSFAHEFKILEVLKGCPNICPLILFDKKNGYAIIDFFEGDTLKTLVNQKSLFILEEKLDIFKQILETAAYMHSRGILHGDWHYHNVLINENNTVKVIDFDLALQLGKNEKSNVSRGGIKEFIPPERIDDSAFEVVTTPPDFRAEVFQIGVLAYYLFFNDYPFKGETWKKMAHSIRNDAPNWEKMGLPNPLIDFLKKAMEKQPEDRFASAIEMEQAFSENLQANF
jgi:eukaryotic-like serine/threonine-protein kinase